ncbi:MAG: YdeI/OmpD-associated family protein [Candidatus Bathyarchaeota archaeon]|nr:MAG: YdeI/OmpD-associated family protein [Candidatus Bathyarchaeota archaeon]
MNDELYVVNRSDWRKWLSRNHDTVEAVWLVYFKKHTGKPRIPYDDAVEEAICFGWIDSLVKRVDDEKYIQKFSPRKTGSTWSELNKKRAETMISEGKMTEAGLIKIEDAKKSGEWFRNPISKGSLAVPSFIQAALNGNLKAKKNFDRLAPTYKRHYIGWITSAKKEETRRRRLKEALELLEQNKKLGLK